MNFGETIFNPLSRPSLKGKVEEVVVGILILVLIFKRLLLIFHT